MTLTEQWKKGELEEYKKYYCKTKSFEDIFQAGCYNKDTKDEWWVLENKKYKYNNIYHIKDIEVLAPVPSYEEWQKVLNIDFNNEVLRLENAKLKELLKEAKDIIEWYKSDCGYKDTPTEAILTKINKAIGENNEKENILRRNIY